MVYDCLFVQLFSNISKIEQEQDKLSFVSFNWEKYNFDSLSDKIQVEENAFVKLDSFVRINIFVSLDIIPSFPQSNSWKMTLYNDTNDTLHFVRRRNYGGAIITFGMNPKMVLPNKEFIINGGILRKGLRGKFHKNPGIQFVSSKRIYQIHAHLRGYAAAVKGEYFPDY